jgi:hypothetical protein
MLRRSFQQSTILSVTHTLTFRSLSIPESQFSQTCQRKAILLGKGDSGFLYSRIDETLVSHLTAIENCRKVNLIGQNHIKNLLAPENGFLLLLGWCPFKIQKEKQAGLQFTSTD